MYCFCRRLISMFPHNIDIILRPLISVTSYNLKYLLTRFKTNVWKHRDWRQAATKAVFTAPNWTELTCTKLTQLHNALLATRVDVTNLIGCRAPVPALQIRTHAFQWSWTELKYSSQTAVLELQPINCVTLMRVTNNASCIWVNGSALTLLVGRQEGHPSCKKTEWWGTGMVICLERGADLHMAQLMPLPLTVSCFSKIQDWFYLSGTGSPG